MRRRAARFEEAVAEFLAYLRDERRVSPETLRAYASDLEQLGAFLCSYNFV